MRYAHGTLQRNATRAIATVTLAASGAILAACSDSSGLGTRASAQLAFTASRASGSAAAALVPVTTGGHTLDLTQASVTISRAELKPAQTSACQGDDDDNVITSGVSAAGATASNDHGNNQDDDSGSCGAVKVGATTIDLPLTGDVVTIPANTIPPGTYRDLELRVSSVRLKGTFDTQAFDVTLPLNARADIPFATPLVVAEGTATSVTVNIPVSTWLTNSDGSLVDPLQISTSSSLASAIRDRIVTSLRAFEDRNHDGKADHGGHDD